MNIIVSEETQRWLEEQMRLGGYRAAEDVIRAGLQALEQEERLASFDPGELQALLVEGEQSIRTDGTLDGAEAFEARRRRRSQQSAASESE